MNFIKKYWGHGLLLILFLFGLSEMPFFQDGPMLSSASGETLSAQLERDVQDALDILGSSHNSREWKSSGFTPQDVLNNTFALKRKDARNALCSVLKALPASDLSMFETALNAPKAQRELRCSASLLEKIRSYWTSETDVADKSHPSKSSSSAITSVSRVIRRDDAREITPDLLQNGEFALVFEGSVDPLITRQIVNALDQHEAHATFMTSGQAAHEHPEVLVMIARSGNSLGSESTEMEDLTLLAMNDAERSVSDGAHAVDAAAGVHSALFAFPFSASNDPLESYVSSRGLKPLRPDLDSADWKTFSATQLIASVKARIKAKSKGIILLHSNLHQTAIALPAILDELAARQRKLVKFDIK